jgi:hypothetical protein
MLNKPGTREAELRAQREAEAERQEKLLADSRKPVNTKPVNTTRRADRHSPGYMAEYMRQRRRGLADA